MNKSYSYINELLNDQNIDVLVDRLSSKSQCHKCKEWKSPKEMLSYTFNGFYDHCIECWLKDGKDKE